MNDSEPTSEPAVIPAEVLDDDSNRWLFVERVREGARGGWATGSFDEKRNKIEIKTRDVQRFRIDTGMIQLDWNKPVVLGIDGKNSELRRRDDPVIYIEVDASGKWIVVGK